MDLTLRPLTAADIPAWADLLNACAAADDSGEHYDIADLEEELANPLMDVSRDTFAAERDGTLLGYGQLIPWGTDGSIHKVIFDAKTHPDHRGNGIGTRLMGAMLDRAEAVRAERFAGANRVWSSSVLVHDSAACDLVEAAGFAAERWSVDMRAVLSEIHPAEVAEVAGLAVVPYDDRYADDLLQVHNDAFLDHPNSSTWTPVMWQHWVTGSRSFRPALTFLAVDPAAAEPVQAYVQCAEYEATAQITGRRELWVARVGTRRSHRGKGVAGALLSTTLAAAKSAGYDDAGLDVDSENPTGALGVYERVGFSVERRWVNCFLRGA